MIILFEGNTVDIPAYIIVGELLPAANSFCRNSRNCLYPSSLANNSLNCFPPNKYLDERNKQDENGYKLNKRCFLFSTHEYD